MLSTISYYYSPKPEFFQRRISMILENHAADAHRMGIPLFIGEWGELGSGPNVEERARIAAAALDRTSIGDTYWAYDDILRGSPVAGVLKARAAAR